MDEALADPNIRVGICSAATKAGFDKIVNSIVGKERLDKLDVCLAGDQVRLATSPKSFIAIINLFQLMYTYDSNQT